MATITAASSGNWNTGGNWTGGAVPGNGDTADLNGKTMTLDITTVPATGTLLGITSAASGGSITIALDTLGSTTINATTISAGSVSMIVVSGTTGNTLTINGDIIGGDNNGDWSQRGAIRHNGTGSIVINGDVSAYTAVANQGYTCHGIYNTSTGSITITGDVTGGRYYNYGIYGTSTGTITVTGNVTGGTSVLSFGIYNQGGANVTLNSCNLVSGSGCIPYAGKPPDWNITTHANYTQLYADLDGAGNTLTKFIVELAASNVKKGVAIYTGSTGTLQVETAGTWSI
jgi:hypothetical protein